MGLIPRRHRSLLYKVLLAVPVLWLMVALLMYSDSGHRASSANGSGDRAGARVGSKVRARARVAPEESGFSEDERGERP